jgi:hypothetical protein
MQKSTQLITDLHALALAKFTPESVERANTQLVGNRTLTILVGIAMARAAELKTTLMEMQRVVDPADPQLGLVNSILSVLN